MHHLLTTHRRILRIFDFTSELILLATAEMGPIVSD